MKRLFVGVFFTVFAVQSVVADTVQVEILAADGQPLANAALLIEREKPPVKVTGQSAVVDQVNKQFTPTVSAVEPGTDVVFPNSDNIRHHVYSFSEAKNFELKLYSDKEKPSVNFDKAGIVTLGCNIHDQMVAYVLVSDEYDIAVTNEQGIVELKVEENSAPAEIRVWHYWMGDELSKAQNVQLTSDSGKLTGQVQVSPPVREDKEPSRLEQRFNRRGN
ncbi:MAG: methylamine utilization protein [Idiomarinaceae bacterium]|uniref:methylamine utilization protein n=1 Tax=unclassified Idiomarina TaxID=2614829 RepID=UPI0002E0C327|nr:methylamine utilization protein [Idiomarina sp. 28-8]MBL4856650.1 methylamine utilization protein [Idiomarina sp.]NWO02489.1 methylamine utilization protein [Idiomarinaceae bacterium]